MHFQNKTPSHSHAADDFIQPGAGGVSQGVPECDGLKPGETFEVERTKAGEYIFRRKKRGSHGLLAVLLACPEKGWFQPIPDTETTDSMKSPFE